MNVRRPLVILVVLFCFTNGFAQSDWYHEQWSESRQNLEIQKVLNPLKVLYIAAHPDDENTRLISWLENHLHADVAYLSLTKGSGGQNLISKEIGSDLGLIREQELLAARRTDGAEQFFSSALDFGYSKTHEETFKKWNKDKVLQDVVYYIRKFKPNIIITRFSPFTEGLRRTHGHHTASAILAMEAFDLANDPTAYPSQLKALDVWKTDAIYWNTSYWSYGGQGILDSIVNAEPNKYIKLNVNTYVPELGKTTSEIAAASRSMHKSQGFGSMARYGEINEYLQFLKGRPQSKDRFSRFSKMLLSSFHRHLETALRNKSKTLDLKAAITENKKLTPDQRERVKHIWANSMGLRMFATTDHYLMNKGKVNVTLQIEHHHSSEIQLIDISSGMEAYLIGERIKTGELFKYSFETSIYNSLEQRKIKLNIEGITLEIPLIYRRSDPVIGEIIQPVHVVNGGQVEILNNELLEINGVKPKVKLALTPVKDVKQLKIIFDGDQVALSEVVNLKAHQTYYFEVEAPTRDKSFLTVQFDKQVENNNSKIIKHDHLPWIFKSVPAVVVTHRITAQMSAKKVGYIMGAGDKVAEATQTLGATVDLLDYETVTPAELRTYDAIVFGIRALNVLENIDAHLEKFYDYAEAGGTLVMQYNTSHRLKTDKIGFEVGEIKLSRGRVTEEDAKVQVLKTHKVLQSPNPMTTADWDNWVQERGLYFPSKWSEDYVAPLGMHDENENQLQGSLLIKQCGKGYFVYTGVSFFRELPAGVNGAYKLWANILSL